MKTESEKPTEAEAVETAEAESEKPDTGEAVIAQLREENEKLRTSIRMASAHRQITAELTRIGARSPELLFDAVRQQIEFADSGEAANTAALIDGLKKRFPEQFEAEPRPGMIDAAAGSTAQPPLSREALARMTPTQIAALDWEAVKRTLRQ